MGLPNVLVIGAQKCGTTALFRLLEAHPDCAVGSRKETNFFVDTAPFGKWFKGIDWYRSLFEHDAPVVADVSPSYAAWPLNDGVPERAASVVPDATIVYLVRDPVERMISSYRHFAWRGYEKRPALEALLDPDPHNRYVVPSRYAQQLERWLTVYNRDKVLVMHQTDVRAGAAAFFARFGLIPPLLPEVRANVSDTRRVDRFPGLPRALKQRLPQRMVTQPLPKPALTEDQRAELRARVADDVAAFSSLTGIDL